MQETFNQERKIVFLWKPDYGSQIVEKFKRENQQLDT